MREMQGFFKSIPDRRYFPFYSPAGNVNYRQVVEQLEFKNKETAIAAGIPEKNVRYDERMPRELADRILQWAICLELVAGHFKGDLSKTALWFRTPNPLLGNLSPRDMIRYGRFKKLLKFIQNAIEEDKQ